MITTDGATHDRICRSALRTEYMIFDRNSLSSPDLYGHKHPDDAALGEIRGLFVAFPEFIQPAESPVTET